MTTDRGPSYAGRMRRSNGAAASPLTWALALVFLLVLDTAITRTQLLWGKTVFAGPRGEREVFDLTYQTLRKIYAGERGPEPRVALLGNSRLIVATREQSVESELARVLPQLDTQVDLLGTFGMGPIIAELLTRHLDRLEPDLVVFTISGSELREPPSHQMENPAYRLLNLGWRDSPVPPRSWSSRVDRWLRTSWRLWRFREFSRDAIQARLLSPRSPAPMSHRFTTTREVLAYARGNDQAASINAAYERWKRRPTLEHFVAYLETGHSLHLQTVALRARQEPIPDQVRSNVDTLDAMFERFARAPWRTLVLLMPENPIVELDTRGDYHQLGRSEREATLIRAAAERHGLSLVDGRRWMPAEAFMDFDHLWRDLSAFETPLAREIANALGS